MIFNVKKLERYPSEPGVYIMKDKRGKVLYVGKAKNLKQRVKQYFQKGGDDRYQIPYLIPQINEIETIVVLSEKEALLLESNLIKQFKPKYNVFLKDDKSYIALKVTTQSQWPKVELIRYRGQPKEKGSYFGPYTSAGSAKETLELIRKVFPLRQCSDTEFARRTRPCILYDMRRCVGPCVKRCTKENYDHLVYRTIRFLQGSDKEVVEEMRQEMQNAADTLDFERAGEILKQIRHIEKTVEKQYVDRPAGGNADVLGLRREGDEVVLAQLLFRAGRLMGIHHFNFSNIAQEDGELITSFVLQQYQKGADFPDELLLPVYIEETKSMGEILSERKGALVKFLHPKRGGKAKWLEMAEANARNVFEQSKDKAMILEKTLMQMQETFKLANYPGRIECFDNSNLSGTEPVSCCIAFKDGEKDKSLYKKFKTNAAGISDDYAAMYEVLRRRLKRGKEEGGLPDLLMIDGGKGHLNVGVRVLRELDIVNVDIVSLAKENSRHDKGATIEKIFLPEIKDPVQLKKNSNLLFLLQRIRDEAHRFAITFQRARRSKQIAKSELDKISGIGAQKKAVLLKNFGSLKNVRQASLEALKKVKGISDKDAATVYNFFQGN